MQVVMEDLRAELIGTVRAELDKTAERSVLNKLQSMC